LAVFGLAAFSNYLMKSKSFLSEYFLGSRSLGVWAFALTFAATSASGGSFTGFPARIYSHGWILALWIASYMVVPICTMGFLGKRINQVARLSDAITVPDVIRDRFRSPGLGLLSVSLIVFFMSFNLVAQFKAGSKILITLLGDNDTFQQGVAWTQSITSGWGFLEGVAPDYFLCLSLFAVAVIAYTTYGGFHAVVWTDVMQGIVMVIGVVIMLPLALYQVGGTGQLASEFREMTPPKVGFVKVSSAVPLAQPQTLNARWVVLDSDGEDGMRLLRLNTPVVLPAQEEGETPATTQDIRYVELTTPIEIERQFQRLKEDRELVVFRNEIKSILEASLETSDSSDLRKASQDIEQIDTAILNNAPGMNLEFEILVEREDAYGADKPGVYAMGPGPSGPNLANTPEDELKKDEASLMTSLGFLPFSVAVSFFFMWAISGSGQPSNMVRLMAFNNAVTLKKSIFTVAMYYTLIYFPLVLIFCSARILLPGLELDPDSIMPRIAVELTANAGQAWLAGLLVAAPFAAIMSTVDSFLLMISSAVVRDIYQRNINPDASENRIKYMSYLTTLIIGVVAMAGAINPPRFLQDIIVYTGSGLSACFLGPIVFALYWPRMNRQGMYGGMLAGFAAHFSMYAAGMSINDSFFTPWRPMGIDPIVIGLLVSFVSTFAVASLTPPPEESLVDRYFRRGKALEESETH
jgi:Na+/proline symporter